MVSVASAIGVIIGSIGLASIINVAGFGAVIVASLIGLALAGLVALLKLVDIVAAPRFDGGGPLR
jgi:hypothetical protein